MLSRRPPQAVEGSASREEDRDETSDRTSVSEHVEPQESAEEEQEEGGRSSADRSTPVEAKPNEEAEKQASTNKIVDEPKTERTERKTVMLASPRSGTISTPGEILKEDTSRQRQRSSQHRPPTPAKRRHIPKLGGETVDAPSRFYSKRFAVLGFVQMNVCFLLLFFAKQGALDGGRPHPGALRLLALGGESGAFVTHPGVCNNDMFIVTGVIGALLSFLPYITAVATASTQRHKNLLVWFGCAEAIGTALAATTVGTGAFGAVITPLSMPGCFFSVWGLGSTLCCLFLAFFMLAFSVEIQKARGAVLPESLMRFTNAMQSKDFYRRQYDKLKSATAKKPRDKGKCRVETGGSLVCMECGERTTLSTSALRNLRVLSTYPCKGCGARVPVYEEESS